MSGWEAYIYQLQNVFDANTQQYTRTNVNEHAAIYGLDGSAWAASSGFQLTSYNHKIETEDGGSKEVAVNEFTCALESTKGNRKPSEAGIRMNGQKFMFIQHNADRNSVYLGREGGGGACVARTTQCVIVGLWNKAGQISDGKLQNPGDCNDLVEKMAEFLKSQGY